MDGRLFVVATPLGNLDDLSPRAAATLRAVACVLCEDTRRTSRLLARHAIRVPLLSCHRFNERARLDEVLARLRGGEHLALVSDGGTPVVSDPGALLVRAALEAGLAVSPVPGPSAVPTLLSVSGLPADRYVFDGFLPHRPGERRRRLADLASETRTLVFFESPQRIRATLADVDAVLGPRRLVLGRELTKRHESILHGTAAEVAVALDPAVRGEITFAVAGAEAGARPLAAPARSTRLAAAWRAALAAAGGDRRLALRRVARELGMGKAELYRTLQELGLEARGE